MRLTENILFLHESRGLDAMFFSATEKKVVEDDVRKRC